MLKREIETETRALLKTLDAIELNPSDAQLARGLDRLRSKARDILHDCSGPIKLGILGEFSAGKTRLIEAMLGLANRLPTGEIPSTGNIVEFHGKCVPGRTRSEFGRFDATNGQFIEAPGYSEIIFVSHAEACDILEFFRAEAVNMIPPSDAEHRRALDTVPNGDWDRWRQWAEQVYQSTRKLELKYLAFEVYRFAQAYQACGAVLSGETIKLSDRAVAAAAMTLPARFGRAADSGLPSCPAVLSSLPDPLSVEQMARLFPLVRKVRLNVGLPEELGRELQNEGDEPFVLVDCPGLGAEESTLRDKFLCLRELRSVESILIVIDSRKPGSNGAIVLHDMMRDAWNANIKERILVALGRFDQSIGDSNLESKQLAEELAESSEPLSANDLFHSLHDPLGTLQKNGLKPLEDGRIDRVTVVSGIAALRALERAHPHLVLGEPDFSRKLFNDRLCRELDASTHLWKSIARRLRQGGPTDKLYADWFWEYGSDGGLSRLKRTCREHLDEHGAANLVAKLNLEFEAVQTEWGVLQAGLRARPSRPSRPGPEPSRAVGMGRAAFLLSGIYHEIVSELAGGGVASLLFRPEGCIDPVSLSEYLRDECIERVGDWDEWKLLFENVDPMRGPGQIKVVERDTEAAAPRKAAPGTRTRQPKVIPTRTDDFFEPFQKTIRAVESRAQSDCKSAIALLLQSHGVKVRTKLGREGPAILEAIEAPGLDDRLRRANLDDDMIEEYAYALLNALTPNNFLDYLAADCGLSSNDRPTDGDQMRAIFPLALKSKDGKRIGRVFHWDPEIARRFGDQIAHGRHQIHVIRNRQALTDSVIFHIHRLVEKYRREVSLTLVQYYSGLAKNLSDLAKAAG